MRIERLDRASGMSWVVIDQIGSLSEPSPWTVCGVDQATNSGLHTMIRKPTITRGNLGNLYPVPSSLQAKRPGVGDCRWVVVLTRSDVPRPCDSKPFLSMPQTGSVAAGLTTSTASGSSRKGLPAAAMSAPQATSASCQMNPLRWRFLSGVSLWDATDSVVALRRRVRSL